MSMSATLKPSRMLAAIAEVAATVQPTPAGPLELAIARVCHEVNRMYCESLGDQSQRPWDDAPDWQKESAIAGVQLHIKNPNAGAAASHEAWMRHKLDNGWTYGAVKDEAKKEHPCMVPFMDLPPEQRAKDVIFRAVVHAIVKEQMR